MGALSLNPTSTSPFDLEVRGLVAGIPQGETRYIKWADLRAMPTTPIKVIGEFVPGEQTVTGLFLSDVWAALPVSTEADVLLADCVDGYASVYPQNTLEQHKPFLILEINGQGPEAWPPAGLKFNPGPYVISVSAGVAPVIADLLDAGHKRPWGVKRLEFANHAKRFASMYEGAWAKLSPRAIQGRELWINSCYSCHAGPVASLGGTKSPRPFAVIVAQATYNKSYFKAYVRDPQKTMPGAKMEAHPHYTDAHLEAMIAFLKAETSKTPNSASSAK
jgi:hypothetical protein